MTARTWIRRFNRRRGPHHPQALKETAHTATAEPLPSVPDRDLELLRGVANGDGAAFGRMAERLGPVLKAVLYRLGLTESEVDDALQETLIRIWKGAAGFRAQSSVSTWACRIAINQGIAILRGRRPIQPLDDLPAHEPAASSEIREQARTIRDAVLSLPVPLRTVVVLREYQDLSYRSIAEVLDIPIGTVMSRLHEGRSRLRRQLAPIH